MLRVLDLFSGIGGFSLGLERTGGFRTVAFCEIDARCRAVLREHWPNVPCYDDIRALTLNQLFVEQRWPFDVICGGFPCQFTSTAARGRNNAADLWPEQIRIIRDCQPTWVVAENVPGLGLGGVDRVCTDLEGEDYTVWPFDLDTAPPGRQRGRQRFMFLAHANGKGQSRRALDAQVAGIRPLSGCGETDDAAPMGMDDGLPDRMDRLAELGNAVSPWAAELVGRAILEAERGFAV